MTEVIRVLVVEDNPADVELVRAYLPVSELVRFEIESVARLSEAIDKLNEKGIDLVFIDLGLPDSQGLETFRQLQKAAPDMPTIVLTGLDDEKIAVTAVRNGAQDYLIKGELNGSVLVRAARYAMERKRAEETLRGSEVRFRELFNRMSSGVAVYEAVDDGEDFYFKDLNPAAEDIEKVSRMDILGKRVSEAFPGVEAFGIFKIFQRVWRTGKSEYFPEALYQDERNPGSWRESWVFKLPSNEIVAIYNDITPRRVAEEALKESENKYRLLADNVDDVIFVLDMNLNYTYVSPSVKILRGYEPEELIKKSSLEMFAPSSRDLTMRTFSEIMELEKSGRHDISISRTLESGNEAQRRDHRVDGGEVFLDQG